MISFALRELPQNITSDHFNSSEKSKKPPGLRPAVFRYPTWEKVL
jgi:hypothetical protein